MSLNRTEQMLHDYLQSHKDERHYWQAKVQKIAKDLPEPSAAASVLDGELWRYFLERSGVAEPFKSFARTFGSRRTSMKSLAEHLLRLWVEPAPRPGNAPSSPRNHAE